MRVCVPKQQAIAQDKLTYFTGKPCAQGHICERYTKGGSCVACNKYYYCNKYNVINYLNTKGISVYYTGKPCRRGHICERYTKGGKCVECTRFWNSTQPGSIKKLKTVNVALEQAKAEGKLTYKPDKPCRRGHICERYIKGGKCLECSKMHSLLRRKIIGKKITKIEQAKAEGKLTYPSSKHCRNGHLCERYITDGRCVECVRIKNRLNKVRDLTKKYSPPPPPPITISNSFIAHMLKKL